MKKIFFLSLFLLSFCLTQQSLYAESITLTTYYPAPFGAYDRLRLVPRAPLSDPGGCAPGTIYVDNITNQMQFCQSDKTWGSVGGVWTKSGNSIYPTDTLSNSNLNVGIGTTAPLAGSSCTGNDGSRLLIDEKGTVPPSAGLSPSHDIGLKTFVLKQTETF